MAAVFSKIPEGTYSLESPHLSKKDKTNLCLGWALSPYQYEYYRKSQSSSKAQKILIWPEGVNQDRVSAFKEAIFWGRDLINTPAVDLGPEHLSQIVKDFAKQVGAKCHVTSGKKLQKEFPAIHAVGKSGEQTPCLIDLTWGNTAHPKLTLIGKGICFDTGGLDLKPSRAMLIMKKDMGGAAYVLALARLIIDLKLPYRLRVLIPAAENGIGPNAMRPMDILNTRKGLTIEIDNTDAEGRLVLADALFEACQEKPDLLIDCATLTGAARIAMGVEVPAFFTNHEKLGPKLVETSKEEQDLLWQLPLVESYRKQIKGQISDLKNMGTSGYGGAITAALFLEEFIDKEVPWIHVDTMAWNTSSTPGRPEGGELMGMRGLFAFIESFFKKNEIPC